MRKPTIDLSLAVQRQFNQRVRREGEETPRYMIELWNARIALAEMRLPACTRSPIHSACLALVIVCDIENVIQVKFRVFSTPVCGVRLGDAVHETTFSAQACPGFAARPG